MGQASTGQARIVSVQKAVPPQYIGQDEVIESVLGDLYGGDLIGLAELFSRSQVRKRHYVWDPRKVLAGSMPMIGDRMRAWERHVLELGEDLVRQSLAGLDPDRIGTFVMVSSTGYTNPGPEVTLAKQFGLRPDLRRTFIGHMGCYAAFNGIKVALDAVAARPAELALVGCVELSSLHMHDEATIEQAVVHSLFGDAGGMVLISAAPDAVGPAIIGTHTETHYASSDAMTLRIHDESFRMTLSPTVPHLLARAIGPFLERLLAPAGLTAADVRHWGVHPGGPKIIDLVGRMLKLDDAQLRPSREVLANYGNCASATILLILHQIVSVSRPGPGEYGVFLAFGPGLTIESMLVRF